MATDDQWRLFRIAAWMLGALAWDRLWAMLLGPTSGAAALLALSGWVASGVACTRIGWEMAGEEEGA